MESTTEKTEPPTASAHPGDVERGEAAITPTVYKRPIPAWQWAFVCVGLSLGALLYGLDTTIAADVQGPILETLGEVEKLAWVGIAFPLGSVAVILLVVWCYALFEIKYILLTSVVLFEAGSALCGAAPTQNALIVGRVLAGVGGAGNYLGALTYFSVFTSPKEKPLYNGLIGFSWGVGAILGPVVGGGFAVSNASWRWAFYINLPLAALCSPVYIFLFPKYNPLPDVAFVAKLKQIDWVGALLNAAVFSLFLITVVMAGSTFAWNSGGMIALWVVFGVCLILFVIQQAFAIFTTRERQLFPVYFLGSRTMVLLYFTMASSAAGLAVGVYFIPIYFQFTRGDDAIQAAVRLLPYICIYVFFVLLVGAILPVVGRYMPIYVLSGVFLIIGGALMHTVNLTTPTASVYGYEVLMAIGAGLSSQTGYAVASAKVEPHLVPNAIGFMNVAQIGTISIALAIAGNIFQNVGFAKLSAVLTPLGVPETLLRSALGGAQSTLLESAPPQIRILVLEALVETLQDEWILIIVAGAVCLVSGLLMRTEKLKLEMAAGG